MKTLISSLLTAGFLFLSMPLLAQIDNEPPLRDQPANTTTDAPLTVENNFIKLSNPISNLDELKGKSITFNKNTYTIDSAIWTSDCKVSMVLQSASTSPTTPTSSTSTGSTSTTPSDLTSTPATTTTTIQTTPASSTSTTPAATTTTQPTTETPTSSSSTTQGTQITQVFDGVKTNAGEALPCPHQQ